LWNVYRRGQVDSLMAIGATAIFILTCAATVAFNFAGR